MAIAQETPAIFDFLDSSFAAFASFPAMSGIESRDCILTTFQHRKHRLIGSFFKRETLYKARDWVVYVHEMCKRVMMCNC